MRFRLDEVQPNKPINKEVYLKGEPIKAISGEILLENADARLRLQTDPLGYLIHYEVSATVTMSCTRCSKPITQETKVKDWLSLRLQQPEHAHIVLDAAEMNIRFIAEPVIDLEAFVKETIELELPPYPRHDGKRTACELISKEYDSGEQTSPFSELSKYL